MRFAGGKREVYRPIIAFSLAPGFVQFDHGGGFQNSNGLRLRYLRLGVLEVVKGVAVTLWETKDVKDKLVYQLSIAGFTECP